MLLVVEHRLFIQRHSYVPQASKFGYFLTNQPLTAGPVDQQIRKFLFTQNYVLCHFCLSKIEHVFRSDKIPKTSRLTGRPRKQIERATSSSVSRTASGLIYKNVENSLNFCLFHHISTASCFFFLAATDIGTVRNGCIEIFVCWFVTLAGVCLHFRLLICYTWWWVLVCLTVDLLHLVVCACIFGCWFFTLDGVCLHIWLLIGYTWSCVLAYLAVDLLNSVVCACMFGCWFFTLGGVCLHVWLLICYTWWCVFACLAVDFLHFMVCAFMIGCWFVTLGGVWLHVWLFDLIHMEVCACMSCWFVTFDEVWLHV